LIWFRDFQHGTLLRGCGVSTLGSGRPGSPSVHRPFTGRKAAAEAPLAFLFFYPLFVTLVESVALGLTPETISRGTRNA
jgi:hypothetical protein